jgi:molybdopterin/thiamine biosynthesis adenylyltransferase/proteasome lid subunit RPN8/RPN11
MTEVVISESALRQLVDALRADVERGAILYLNRNTVAQSYLVHEVEIAGPQDILHSTATQITFAPQFLVAVTRRARATGHSLAFVHTHPSGFPDFSVVDDQTERQLADFLKERNPEGHSLSIVLCDGIPVARCFGTRERVAIRSVGEKVTTFQDSSDVQASTRYDRQIRAFGEDGQSVLRKLSIAIVGLGGTGSVAAQQLSHLGVGRFILVDPDLLEDTNLNRVVGTSDGSVGQYKVEIAAALIRRINPDAEVHPYKGSAMDPAAIELLQSANAIFICTDSHVSRAHLSEFSYQYLIPAFDIGVSIDARDGVVGAITGRDQMLGPGLPCLTCSDALDPKRIREELMTPEQQAADPYFNEEGVSQPAVISFNSAMVSMAVTMFLGAFTDIPVRSRWQSYDALSGTVRILSTKSDVECTICGPAGVVGAGDSRELTLVRLEF